MSIRIGIIGLEFGSKVLVPAFRMDPRCEVVALCGTSLEKTQGMARELGVRLAFADYRNLLNCVDAVVSSVPPGPQVEIALEALGRGIPIFVEKPLGINPDQTARLCALAMEKGTPTMVDFEFIEIPAWQECRRAIKEFGLPEQFKMEWMVQTYIAKHFIQSWKCEPAQGGGALHVFGSHVMHNLEWFCGTMLSIRAKLFKRPEDPRDTHTGFELEVGFSGATKGLVRVDTNSNDVFLHRWKFRDLVIENCGSDYVRDFKLLEREKVRVPAPGGTADGRITAVGAMARRFLNSVETKCPVEPSFIAGHRAQVLIAAAFKSSQKGVTVSVAP